MAKKNLTIGIFLACVISSCVRTPSEVEEQPHWNNINVIRENTERPRAHFTPYRNNDDAPIADREANPKMMSLNGSWKFFYTKTPAERPPRLPCS